MQKLISIFFLLVFVYSCHKVGDSLDGRVVYAGKIYLMDSLTKDYTRGITDSIVKFKVYEEGSTNYLYTQNTSNKGDFVLDFLEQGKRYTLQATLKVNNVSYKGDTTFTVTTDIDRKYYLTLINDTIPLTLYADISKRNFVSIPITDVNGQNIPMAQGCLFSSTELFKTRSCLNSNYNSSADASGKLTFSNIKEGLYYLYVEKRLDTIPGASKLSGLDTFTINNGGALVRPSLIIK